MMKIWDENWLIKASRSVACIMESTCDCVRRISVHRVVVLFCRRGNTVVAKYGEEGRLFDLSVRCCGYFCMMRVVLPAVNTSLDHHKKDSNSSYGYAGFGEHRR